MTTLSLRQLIEDQETDNLEPIKFNMSQIKDLYMLCKSSKGHKKRGFTYFSGETDVVDEFVFDFKDLDQVRKLWQNQKPYVGLNSNSSYPATHPTTPIHPCRKVRI